MGELSVLALLTIVSGQGFSPDLSHPGDIGPGIFRDSGVPILPYDLLSPFPTQEGAGPPFARASGSVLPTLPAPPPGNPNGERPPNGPPPNRGSWWYGARPPYVYRATFSTRTGTTRSVHRRLASVWHVCEGGPPGERPRVTGETSGSRLPTSYDLPRIRSNRA